jgi:hypothetical protein
VIDTLPATADLIALARRVIWFEPPHKALADPVRLTAYTLTYGAHADCQTLRRHLSDDDLRAALDRAPPGIFDPRSWAYWNLCLGRYPTPPLPERRLHDEDDQPDCRP